ncbi:MAG: methyltransferase domain-containing protein [Ardenticatenia bacterium]|nr:methyltransferase domain-containing protein [Ardenticatenia bacterium]
MTELETGRPIAGERPAGGIAGMIELRHVADDQARAAYDALYARAGIQNLVGHLDWLLDQLDTRPGMRLLDVACGEGELVRLACRRGLAAQGADLSQVALTRGGIGLAPGVLVAADGTALPFPRGHFQRLTSVGSLEHYADMPAGLSEMARVLDPAGLALILVPNSFGLRWNVLHVWRTGDVHDDGQPIQRYGTRRQWQRLIEAAGLEVLRCLGSEGTEGAPLRGRDLAGLVRHPSRLLGLAASWLPVDLASMLVFICRPTATIGPGAAEG